MATVSTNPEPEIRLDLVSQVVGAIEAHADENGYFVDESEYAEYVAIFSKREGLTLSESEVKEACNWLMYVVFE